MANSDSWWLQLVINGIIHSINVFSLTLLTKRAITAGTFVGLWKWCHSDIAASCLELSFRSWGRFRKTSEVYHTADNWLDWIGCDYLLSPEFYNPTFSNVFGTGC